jgi:small subunit ribosomal protein S5
LRDSGCQLLLKADAGSFQLKDQVVSINRVTKVVKGGKNLSFAARWCGGRSFGGGGRIRFRQSQEVPQAIRKESNRRREPDEDQPDPNHRAAHCPGTLRIGPVLLKPAPEGTQA